MARLSAENSTEHVDKLKTPEAKGSKKVSRFKDFFKGGHSRNTLSMDSGSSLPVASSPVASSPIAPSFEASPQGGVENLKPGFTKVGLHPIERSGVLDLEEWEKVKEENQDLSHREKMKLYKERQQTKRREMVEGENENEKAMKILGIEDHLAKDKDTVVAELEGDEASIAQELADESEYEQYEKNTVDVKTESLRKTCEGSSSDSDGPDSKSGGVGLGADAAADYTPRHTTRVRSKSNPENVPVLRHSPSLKDLRSSARDPHENDSTCANPSTSQDGEDSDGIDRRDFHFRRFGLFDTDGLPTHGPPFSTADSIHSNTVDLDTTTARTIASAINALKRDHSPSKTATTHMEVPAIKVFKIGPCTLEASTATALRESLLPFMYMIILFLKALEGPFEFATTAWKLGVVLLAYDGVRKLMGWHEDGSSDVLLAPAELLGRKVLDKGTEVAAAIIGALAHAIAVALREMNSGRGL